MQRAILRISLSFFAACAAAAAPAHPGLEAAPPVCPSIDPPAPTAGAGLRAFVDPVTGKLRPPTAAEKRQLVAARDRASRTYEVVVRPDGSRVVVLDDAFSMSVVATTSPDGALRYRCVSRRAHPAAEEK